jgi:hexokinase
MCFDPEKGADFLRRHRMHPEHLSFDTCTQTFLSHMERGLRGEPSTLLMLPTYLTTGAPLPLERPVAVIDAGGTHLRTALVTLTAHGPVVEHLQTGPVPGSLSPVTWDEFMDVVARQLLPLLSYTRSIGFCFSHVMQSMPNRDARVVSISKQAQVSHAAGQLLCASLSDSLAGLGEAGIQAVALNDTVATLLGGMAFFPQSEYSSFFGLVYGTGTNTCCALPCCKIPKLDSNRWTGSMLLNLESGGFSALLQGDIDWELDHSTRDPGTFLLEKMSSGAYLGPLIGLTLRRAAQEGLLSPGFLQLPLCSTIQTDQFLRAPAGDSLLAQACADLQDRQAVSYFITQLTRRAAKLICANLAALFLLTGEGRSPAHPACIIAEGSTFDKSKLFRPMLEREMDAFLSRRLGRHWVIRQVEQTNLLGSAAAALLNLG